MSDQTDIEEFHWNEDLMSESSENVMPKENLKSRSALRDSVLKSFLPQNFESLKKFLDPSGNSNVNRYKSQSTTSPSTRKEKSEALKAFQEISYMKFKKIQSSEEESCCSKDSHVDSEDSGLFKEGYVFQRKSQLISKGTVNKKVKKWKKKASEQLEEVNKMYKHGRYKNKETFSLPLGLEANRKINAEPPDDGSSQSQSIMSGQYNTEDEIDVRRNEEFMREVRRVLRRRKNPQTLEKRSLPEEYSRLIFKKTAFARNWNQQTQTALALTEMGEPLTENTDLGADGDNTSEPVTGIFDQLSNMVLKNKILKNSKAAQQRNEVLRRVEEKRGFVGVEENSGADKKVVTKMADKKSKNEEKPGLSGEVQMTSYNDKPHQESIENQSELQIAEPDEFVDLVDLKDTTKRRLKKVESYLSSVSDAQLISPPMPEISEMTLEREKSLFDNLAGEFLKNMASGNGRKNKITSNDKKLLTVIVKRFIDRGELARIDELMSSNLNENMFEVPPYENVTDREEFFLKKIIRKFIKRGMRDTLEDLIAWIYYKLDARNNEDQDKQEGKLWREKEVRDMVNAFKNSGKNSSMNRIIMQLLREHKKINPGLNARQISAVKENIKTLVIERFARMYLERTKTDVDQSSEPYALAVNVKDEFEMNNGTERIDVNGRNIQINWEFVTAQGDPEETHQINTEHETDKESSVDGTPPCRALEPITLNPNATAITHNFGKEVKFVKERLEDIVWNVQQSYQRQKAGKAIRTCSLVKKRSVTMIGDPYKVGKLNVKGMEKKLNFEERRKQMREEHVKWLLEQKEMLRAAKKKEAQNVEKFTQALPKRLENMIARQNRSMKLLGHKRATDRQKF